MLKGKERGKGKGKRKGKGKQMERERQGRKEYGMERNVKGKETVMNLFIRGLVFSYSET